MIIDWKTHKEKILKDPTFVEELKKTELEYSIAKAVIEARIKKGLTQSELAVRMKTKQSVISRLEQAKTTPSLSFLKRLAQALNFNLQVSFR